MQDAVEKCKPLSSDELLHFDYDTACGQWALSLLMPIFTGCPQAPLAQEFFAGLAQRVVRWWDDENQGAMQRRRRRNYRCEYECSEDLARFVLKLDEEKAIRVARPMRPHDGPARKTQEA